LLFPSTIGIIRARPPLNEEEADIMTKYVVYLETGEEALSEGGYLAHVPALPGCVARGSNREATLAKLRETIRAYLALLRKHGETVGDSGPVELEVCETESTIFPPDYEALSRDDLTRLLRWMDISRRELLATLAEVPADALDWRPDEASWSIRTILAHLAQADLWYGSRLSEAGLTELEWRLGATRELTTGRLKDVVEAGEAEVTSHGGEEWTGRKVARRVIEHEQEHLDQIREIINAYKGRTG
jgi:predicted RNase H-like HicB family nuclease/uncharacterized damage-inducible protein DinB